MVETDIKTQLRPERETFCQLYTLDMELKGNGTLCYAEAYGYELNSLSRETIKDMDGNIISESEYDKQYHVCSTAASRLLRDDDIKARIRELLKEYLNDDVLDAELAKIIIQDRDLAVKRHAIADANKLKGRIIERFDGKVSGNLTISKLLDQLDDGPKTAGQSVENISSLQDQE